MRGLSGFLKGTSSWDLFNYNTIFKDRKELDYGKDYRDGDAIGQDDS